MPAPRAVGFRVAVATFVLAACSRAPEPKPKPEPEPSSSGPDVVIVSIESLRADFVGAYGSKLGATPSLDALAESSIVVDRAYATGPWTRASVGSVLTGVMPRGHGAGKKSDARPLPAALPTLPETLAAAGYDTYAYVTNPNLNQTSGFPRGFDVYDYELKADAGVVNEAALRWLRARPSGDRPPVFMFLHYNEPHDSHYGATFDYGRLARDDVAAIAELTDPERVACVARYLEDIRAVDKAVGEFLAAADPALRDPIVIVTADHGQEWFDHGWVFHGYTLYREVLAVPLIARLPETDPARVPGPISQLDLMPTICDWTGVSCPDDLDGASAAAGFAGKASPPDIFAQTEYLASLESIEHEGYKLIRDRTSGHVELYDVAGDLYEQSDVAQAQPARVSELSALLDAHARSSRPPPPLPKHSGSAADERSRRALESLGYIGNTNPAALPVGLHAGHAGFRNTPVSALLERWQIVRPGDPRMKNLGGAWTAAARGPTVRVEPGSGLKFEVPFSTGFLVLANPLFEDTALPASLSVAGKPAVTAGTAERRRRWLAPYEAAGSPPYQLELQVPIDGAPIVFAGLVVARP